MAKQCYCVTLDLSEPLMVHVHADDERQLGNFDNDELTEIVLQNDPGFRITHVRKCEEHDKVHTTVEAPEEP